MTIEPNDDAPPDSRKRPKRWPAFLVGLLLGAGIAVGVMLALRETPFFGVGVNHDVAQAPKDADSRPTDDEVLAYLDGKSFTVPGDEKLAGRTVPIERDRMVELKWLSGGQVTGYENPWTYSYSALYSNDGKDFLIDFAVKVRPIGARRAFLGVEFRKITPVEKVVIPKRP